MADKLSLGITIGAALDKTFGRTMGSAMRSTVKIGDALEKISSKRLAIDGLQKTEANLDELRGSLQAAQKRVFDLKRQMASGQGGDQLAAELERAQNKASGLATKVALARDKLRSAKQTVQASGATIGNYAAQLNTLGSAYDRLAAKQKRFNALETAKSQFGQARGKALGATATAGVGGYAIGRFLAPSVDFEKQMSKVGALARLDKNSEQFKALSEQARALGGSTSFTGADVARGQSFLAMAGFTPESIKAAMPGMLNLAKAGDIDLAAASDITSNILSGFNMGAAETGRLGDVLAATFTRSNTNLSMLGETMKYVAPQASAVGASVEVVGAMAAKLGDVGIQGSMAGTSMRAIFSRLAGPPAQAAKALEHLGVKTKDSAGNLRPVLDILAELDKKTQGMGSADRAAILKDIAGANAGSAMIELVKQAGSGGLQDFVGVLQSSAGESEAIAKKMADNLAGDLIKMGSAWQSLSTSIYKSIKPALRFLTQGFTSVISVVTDFTDAFPVLSKNVLAVGGALAGLWVGVSVFKALALGVKVLGLAVALNPFTLAIGTVVAGLVLVAANWNWVKTTAIEAFTAIGNFIGSIWDEIKWTAIEAFYAIGNFFGDAWNEIKWTAIEAWETLDHFFGGIWNRIAAVFSGGLAGIGKLIVDWSPLGLFYKAFVGVMDWFGIDLPKSFNDFGKNILDGLIGGIFDGLGKLKDSVVTIGDTIKGFFTDTLGINSPSKVFEGFGQNITEGAALGITGSLSKARGAAGALAAATTLGAAGMAGAGAAAPGVGGHPQITQHFHIVQAPGEDGEALAQRVAALVQDAQSFHARSAFVDLSAG